MKRFAVFLWWFLVLGNVAGCIFGIYRRDFVMAGVNLIAVALMLTARRPRLA